jgi:DNA-binding IclR family transcriptional regulator
MRTTIIDIVTALNEHGPLSIAELCERLGREWNTVRRALTALQNARWVRPKGFRRRFKGGPAGVAWESLVKIERKERTR